MATSSIVLTLLVLVLLITVSSAFRCATCVDGKIAYNRNLFNFHIPPKGEYPYCRFQRVDVEPTWVDCKTTCVASELMRGADIMGFVRLCSDGIFKNGSVYTKPAAFAPVPAGQYKNYSINTRVCNTDMCNFDAVLLFVKPPNNNDHLISPVSNEHRHQETTSSASGVFFSIFASLMTFLHY